LNPGHKPFICAFFLAVSLPFPVAAHLGVKSSSPAKNDTLHSIVSSVQITFTQRIELRYTHVFVVTAAGDTIHGQLAIDSTGVALDVRLAQPLLDGQYAVLWRAAGADGHVVNGNFMFTVVGVTPPPPVPLETAGVPPGHGKLLPEAIRDVNQSASAVLMRWLNYLFALLLTGGAMFQLLAIGRSATAPGEYWTAVSQGARRIAVLAVLGSLILAVPRFATQSSLLNGSDHTWDTALIGPMLRETNWGRGWLLQLLGGAGYLLFVFAATSESTGAWLLAGAATVMVAFGIAFSGHAAGVEQMQIVNIANDAMHLLAVGAWVGTLGYFVLVAVPVAVRTRGYEELARLVRAFSPLALGLAAVAVITGSVSALSHIGPLTDLWTTSYGRMLLLKLLGVAGVAGVGFYNWRRLKPTLGSETATYRLRRSAASEAALALLVLLATAVLVALPTP
jgi:copper transport protein